MRVFAYRATAAGIARRQQERGQPIAAIDAVREEIALVVAPVASNVVRLVIPRTPAQQIIVDIAHKHGLTYADLVGHRRWRHMVPARDEAMAAVKALKVDGDKWSYSLPVIGRLFGGRDHTTVLTALRRHAKRGQT